MPSSSKLLVRVQLMDSSSLESSPFIRGFGMTSVTSLGEGLVQDAYDVVSPSLTSFPAILAPLKLELVCPTNNIHLLFCEYSGLVYN
jgi:hypothetical protein